MAEYILEFGNGLYDEKTGEAVFKPKINGKLIRCKDCKYRYSYGCCNFAAEPQDDDFCSRAERKQEETD